MLGLGWIEIIMLGGCGFLVVGGALAAVVVALSMGRQPKSSDESSELSELREENRRLRAEIDKLKGSFK